MGDRLQDGDLNVDVSNTRALLRRRMLRASCCAAVAVCMSFGVARAQSARQACAADAHTYCTGVQPGGGRIVACLKQNFPKLSPDCQSALEKARAQQ